MVSWTIAFSLFRLMDCREENVSYNYLVLESNITAIVLSAIALKFSRPGRRGSYALRALLRQ